MESFGTVDGRFNDDNDPVRCMVLILRSGRVSTEVLVDQINKMGLMLRPYAGADCNKAANIVLPICPQAGSGE